MEIAQPSFTVPSGLRVCPVPITAPASSTTGATEAVYAVEVFVLAPATIAGVRYRTGTGAASGTVKSALYDSSTQKLAENTTGVAQAAANTLQVVDFDASVDVVPGRYLMMLWFSSATATWNGARLLASASASTGVGAGCPATAIASAPQAADRPLMTLK